MSTTYAQDSALHWSQIHRVAAAGLLTGVADALYAVAHTWMLKGQFLPVRIFQGVAAGVLGMDSFKGGTGTALLGLALHFLIALIWATVFFAAVRTVPLIRNVVHSPYGTLKVATLYGPFIWITMHSVVMPLAGLKPGPVASWSFVIMMIAHIFSVGLPIVTVIRDGETH